MSYGLQSYQKAKTTTASREDVLIMLYEGAIRFLERSIMELERGNLAEHKNFLRKGRAIIEEFQNTLDFEIGGEITIQLYDLYEFMLDYLTKANLTKDKLFIEKVVHQLTILLDGWRGAARQFKANPPPDSTRSSFEIGAG